MRRFELLTPDTATGAARDLLADIEARRGTPGPMVRMMAHSPAVLSGYLDLSRAMKRAKLDRRVSERISVAIQQRLGCDVCLDAHTSAARNVGVDSDEIQLARQSTSSDPAIAAMLAYALQVHTEPASITDEQVTALRQHGYSDREITEVIGLVALNLLTGSFNLVTGNHLEETSEETAPA